MTVPSDASPLDRMLDASRQLETGLGGWLQFYAQGRCSVEDVLENARQAVVALAEQRRIAEEADNTFRQREKITKVTGKPIYFMSSELVALFEALDRPFAARVSTFFAHLPYARAMLYSAGLADVCERVKAMLTTRQTGELQPPRPADAAGSSGEGA